MIMLFTAQDAVVIIVQTMITTASCAGEAIKACFVCDECNWYDGNLKNRDMTCRQCEDYIVTNQHAEYLRKRIKVIKR